MAVRTHVQLRPHQHQIETKEEEEHLAHRFQESMSFVQIRNIERVIPDANDLGREVKDGYEEES